MFEGKKIIKNFRVPAKTEKDHVPISTEKSIKLAHGHNTKTYSGKILKKKKKSYLRIQMSRNTRRIRRRSNGRQPTQRRFQSVAAGAPEPEISDGHFPLVF